MDTSKPADQRLNIFQRLIRQWDRLHPYNAGQIMRLAGNPDVARFESAWHETLRALGLGPVTVRGSRFRFEHLNGAATSPVLHSSHVPLDEFVTTELNRPFVEGEIPFRPFLVTDTSHFFAGIIYQHWVADSASIRIVMREWFRHVFDPANATEAAMTLAAGGYWHYFGPGRAGWRLLPGVLAGLKWTRQMKRVRRIEKSHAGDLSMRFTVHDAPSGTIQRVIEAAREQKVTVNDLFLAAIAQACHQLGPSRPNAKRPGLALGAVVDLRGLARSGLPGDDFGLFLGFTSVVLHPGDFETPDSLLDRIATQSLAQKARGAAAASMIRITAGALAGSIFGEARIKNFYRKRFPLAGGISNVNMNHSWAREYHPSPLLDYIRVSPTGPMMPLVFTPTTLGNQLNFGLTCRRSVISDDLSRRLAGAFIDNLRALSS